MHPISKTLLGSLFILSPLSAAMADEAVQQFPVIKNTVANLVEQDSQKTLAAVTVIDREEIERKQYSTLLEALKTVPGISLAANGGWGTTSSVSIRGTKASQILVLIDGQKVGSATTGQTAFEHIPLEQIERIEVLRGARSSLYGSEAVGGVIQIFTRKASQDGVKPFASFTYGSHETYQGNAGVNIKSGNGWVTASLAGLKTQGIDATSKPVELDKDGYENKSASIKGGYKFSEQLKIEANALTAQGENEYDGGIDPYSETQQNVYGAALTYQPAESWISELRIGQTEDKLKGFDNNKFSYEINTERQNAGLLNTFKINSDHTLMFGVDYQNDQVSGNTHYDVDERDNLGYFAQYLGAFGNFDVQGAIRLDDNEQFGEHTTGNASLGYQFSPALQTYISYGKAFKAPTFNDLYYPAYASEYKGYTWSGVSNPNLKPEESENYEIGFKGALSSVSYELTGFYNEIDHKITKETTYTPTGEHSTLINIDKARIKGVELSLGQNLNNFMWNMNYTYQEPENRSGVNNGKKIANIPQQLFNLSADYEMDKWIVGGSVHAEDKRYSADNKTYLGSFATADARVTYQATPELSIQTKLANIFDKQYQTINGYNQDGRTAWVTLRYAMK